MNLSFESLKLLLIYLLLLSGLIYWHDAHIYLFITFTRMVQGCLFMSRTDFFKGWLRRQELVWELELAFFARVSTVQLQPLRLLFLAGKLLTHSWQNSQKNGKAITGWQRHGWQWVDLPYLTLLQPNIFFLVTNFVLFFKMDVSWVIVKWHCLQDWMLNILHQ